MNILFAISFVRWGGVNTWMLELAESLQSRGHHVAILAPKGHLMLKKSHEKKLETVDRDFGQVQANDPVVAGEGFVA